MKPNGGQFAAADPLGLPSGVGAVSLDGRLAERQGPLCLVYMIVTERSGSSLSGEQRESDLHKSDAGIKSRKRCAAGHYADRDQQRVRLVLVA